jgi:hypothetical protein
MRRKVSTLYTYVLELAARIRVWPRPRLVDGCDEARDLARGLVDLQDGFGDLEWLRKQDGGVVPQRLVYDFLGVAGEGGRVVGEVRVVVEVGEDVARLAAEAGLGRP